MAKASRKEIKRRVAKRRRTMRKRYGHGGDRRIRKQKRNQRRKDIHDRAANEQTAIVTVEKPLVLATPSMRSMVSMVAKVKETVEDMERVRRFISTALNIDMQKWEQKHPYPDSGTDEQKKEWDEAHRELMVDWGIIPGVEKPFLMQPGAEKFMFWLEIKPKYFNREIEQGDGHLEIVSHVVFIHKRTKEEVFEGPDCSCSTLEDNFRYIWAEKKDPCTCSIKYDCFKVGGACDGGRYKERQKEINMGKSKKVSRYKNGKFVGKEWGWFERVPVPNIHNKRNNVRQIGQKRALVKGVRNMGAISEIFTQPPDEWDIPEEREDTPETDKDYTESGRPVYVDGVSPSGRRTDPAAAGRSQNVEAEATLKAKGAAFWCAEHNVPLNERHYNTCESARKAIEMEKSGKNPDGTPLTPNTPAPTPGCPQQPGAPFLGRIEVDCTNPDEPVVRGDLDKWVDGLQKHCAAVHRDGWWRIPPEHVNTVAAMCKQANYEFVRIDPQVKKSTPVKKSAPKSGRRATPGEHVIEGIIEKALPKQGSKPRVDFLVKTDRGSFWMGCFSKTWFTRLAEEPLPKPATLVISTKIQDEQKNIIYRNILRATKIGRKEYDDEGKEVIQQRDREAGGKTLFP